MRDTWQTKRKQALGRAKQLGALPGCLLVADVTIVITWSLDPSPRRQSTSASGRVWVVDANKPCVDWWSWEAP